MNWEAISTIAEIVGATAVEVRSVLRLPYGSTPGRKSWFFVDKAELFSHPEESLSAEWSRGDRNTATLLD